MNKEVYLRLSNLFLRGISMLSKFALVICIAKFLTLEEVGTYGLFAATISFSVIALGGEFYTYSQRELLSVERGQWSSVLRNQALASLLLYFVFLPAQLLIFYKGFIPFNLMLVYFIILVLEHVAQELNRILIAMHKQLVASIILFFRLGAWGWVAIGLFYIDPTFRTLDTVLYLWALGTTTAIVISLIYISKWVPGFNKAEFDWQWIRRGYTVAAKFFISTICVKVIMTFDRYVVESVSGTDFLAVYAVYASIAMAVNSVLVPTVFSFMYPRLVESYRKNNLEQYKKNLKEMLYSTLLIGGGVSVVIGGLSPFVFTWVDKAIYGEHIVYLWWLLLFSFLYCLSMVPHYVLYAKGKDKEILISHISSAIVFSVGAGLCYLNRNIEILFWTLSLSMFSMLIIKSVFAGNSASA